MPRCTGLTTMAWPSLISGCPFSAGLASMAHGWPSHIHTDDHTLLLPSDTSTFSSFDVKDTSNLALSQNETYTMAKPGPVPARQDAPHLHHTILDPSKKFMVVPDLGADLLRVYVLHRGYIAWSEIDPVQALPGSGPRHGVFATAGPKTFFYVLNELSNTITGYKVTYAPGALRMDRLFDVSSHGPGGSVPAGTSAAELKISVSRSYFCSEPQDAFPCEPFLLILVLPPYNSPTRGSSSLPRAARTR